MALNSISLLPFALDKLYLGYPITFYQILIYVSNIILSETENEKTPAQSVSVHSGCRGIVVHIYDTTKKAPAQC